MIQTVSRGEYKEIIMLTEVVELIKEVVEEVVFTEVMMLTEVVEEVVFTEILLEKKNGLVLVMGEYLVSRVT